MQTTADQSAQPLDKAVPLAEAALVVIDDDPTGAQAAANVPVLFEFDSQLIRDAAGPPSPTAIHLLTNARSLTARRAREAVEAAARAAIASLESPRIVLRGDSTLRGHPYEEYLGLCDGALGGRRPPLMLVPALPAAQRVTIGGTQYLVRDGQHVPLNETEYARDYGFAYRSARLVDWAEERSGGFFSARDGIEFSLEKLRAGGPAAVAARLRLMQGHAVFVPDAETIADLEIIALGLTLAQEDGLEIVVRAGPAFVSVLARSVSGTYAALAPFDGPVLVVCGSFVPTTTAQLEELERRHPGVTVQADAHALVSEQPQTEIRRLAATAGRSLRQRGIAVIATPRERDPTFDTLDAQACLAKRLARATASVSPRPGLVLAKGGVTAATVAHTGLGARRADVLGPLVDGVSLWYLAIDGERLPLVVFPGNVGERTTLADVVDLTLSVRTSTGLTC